MYLSNPILMPVLRVFLPIILPYEQFVTVIHLTLPLVVILPHNPLIEDPFIS